MNAYFSSKGAVSVYLIEDNLSFAQELGAYLAERPNLRFLGHQARGRIGITEIMRLRPDVSLIDLNLPDVDGSRVIAGLRQAGFSREILALTVVDDDEAIFQALRAGATGYLIKADCDFPQIEKAIFDVVKGEAPMSAGLARRILRFLQTAERPARQAGFDVLSQREQDILTLLSKGYTPRDVTAVLSISYETVRTHQKNIYKKFQVNSLEEALAVYHRNI